MTSLNISLPGPLKKFIDTQVKQGSYRTPSDYVRHLVREAQLRQRGHELREQIDQNLLAALESGEATEMTAKDWADIRRRVLGPKNRRQR
ncbi:MAG TPA: type II toxin-antitoxin system ParD family antitoxin [Candidatus Margulisiibacteriota bacterium]|nr:type II toxin-antitoxin system ParD family antitoxin [Candidatus Margulisiibacteriota bacterium]